MAKAISGSFFFDSNPKMVLLFHDHIHHSHVSWSWEDNPINMANNLFR